MAIQISKVQSKRTVIAQKKENPFSFLNKEIKFFGSVMNDKKKERFYSELKTLLSAGVDIRSSLELIEEEQLKEKDKLLFTQLKESIVGGSSLSKAIEQAGVFSNYEFYSIQIGEESGRLDEVLQELALFFNKKIKQKRQLTSALSYPAIVLSISMGVVWFMLKFVVPMFADIFKRFKGELPYFTRMILRVSDLSSHYSLYLIVVLLGLITFLYTQRKQTWFRKSTSYLLLRTPIMKTMISKIYLARFCQSMNLLISSKTPLVTSIDLVSKMIGFYPIEISLAVVKEDIMRGESLHSSLSKFKIYNKRMVSLIKVAEEVNQMDIMFSRMATQYSEEVEHQTAILGSLIEPILMIFLGALITVILVSMYLPMFQMNNIIH